MRKSETYRNEIKSYIVRTGMTMTEVVDYLSDEYGWPASPEANKLLPFLFFFRFFLLFKKQLDKRLCFDYSIANER